MRTKSEGAIDLERWCFDHFVSKSAMDEVCQLRDQIKKVWTRELKQSYLTLSLAKRTEPGYSTAVRRALAEGFFTRTAVRHKGRYTNVHDAQPGLVLHTSSTVESDWIVYDSFVQYGVQYFQVVTAIEPEWIMVSDAILLAQPSFLHPCVTAASSRGFDEDDANLRIGPALFPGFPPSPQVQP